MQGKKILFVCLGNICRSALAEGILLHLAKVHNVSCVIDSAGTAAYHIGEAPDIRTIKNARKHGIDISSLRARQFETRDFERFDRIFVMDKSNLSKLQALPNFRLKAKEVDLFRNIIDAGKNLDVPDPYYGDESVFEEVFQLIYSGCEQLCLQLKLNNEG